MNDLLEYIKIPINENGVEEILLHVTFDLDTEFDKEYCHRWYIILNYIDTFGNISKDYRFEFEDVHFLYVLKCIMDFLRDNGNPLGKELLQDIRWYDRTILPHLENPEILLVNGGPSDALFSEELIYFRSCTKLHGQNHIITIFKNDGFVWTPAINR